MQKLARPWEILAITFTNKATNEMRERLEKMLGEECGVWIFTFHALCVRILRRFIKNLGGYTSSFSIYGESEKEQCVKRIIKRLQLEDEKAKEIINSIGEAKSNGLSPEEYEKIYSWRDGIKTICRVYNEYEKELKNCNSLDYDDLLNKTLLLLKTDREALEFFANKFRYIHVDEFQDTNTVQYDIMRLLGSVHKNVFVVGDEDQSIYGWRGANFENMFRFCDDFGAKVFKLEQNYRSTKKILALANKIIKKNTQRHDKVLWTNNAEGTDVTYYTARGDGNEGDFVIKTIYDLKIRHGYSYSDFAVLMRVNSLSRTFEERLMSYGINHRVYGGFKFYDRKEVKDLLAYLKLTSNHADTEAILRVINFPRRGIGESSVKQVLNYALVTGQTLYQVLYDIENNPDLPNGLIKKMLPFSITLRCIEDAVNKGANPYDLACYIVKLINLKECYAEDTEENKSRKENVRELLHAIELFVKNNPDGTLFDYLQQVSLYSDMDEDFDGECVTLATVHSAKGLEFKVVFVVGLEEGIFPDGRCDDDPSELQEERRLMYVAVTRAMERLYLTSARQRFRFGQIKDCMPSRFLREGGFIKEREVTARPTANFGSSMGGSSYRGERNYSSSPSGYNREELPLDNGPSTPAPAKKKINPSDYKVGAKVKHKKFGVGTIISLENRGELCAKIDFETAGTMLLMLAYAPLEIL